MIVNSFFKIILKNIQITDRAFAVGNLCILPYVGNDLFGRIVEFFGVLYVIHHGL